MYWNINNRGNSDFFYCNYVLTYYLLVVIVIAISDNKLATNINVKFPKMEKNFMANIV